MLYAAATKFGGRPSAMLGAGLSDWEALGIDLAALRAGLDREQQEQRREQLRARWRK